MGFIYFNKSPCSVEQGDFFYEQEEKRLKKISGLLVIIVLAMAVFMGCNQVATTTTTITSTTQVVTTITADFPMTLTDQLGRTVTIDKVPQRIISLSPSNTEILYALGLGDKIVGVTDWCNYPPEAADKPSIGGFSTPDIEKIISLAPDLILADSIQEDEVIPQLEEIGLTVVGLSPDDIGIGEVLQAITLVGKVAGAEEAANILVSKMQSEIDSIVDKTKDLTEEEKPLVFYIIWHEPLMTAGSGTMEDELIRLAGGINMNGDLIRYPDISLEAVLAANPEVIITGIGMGTGGDATFQFARTEPRLAGISARQNDRIYGVATDLSGRTGPRLIIALQQFAAAIHPELFPVTE